MTESEEVFIVEYEERLFIVEEQEIFIVFPETPK